MDMGSSPSEQLLFGTREQAMDGASELPIAGPHLLPSRPLPTGITVGIFNNWRGDIS